MSKYNAKKVIIDGITFDSKAEGAYYERLLKLKKSGVVEDFAMQKVFTLLEMMVRDMKDAEVAQ